MSERAFEHGFRGIHGFLFPTMWKSSKFETRSSKQVMKIQRSNGENGGRFEKYESRLTLTGLTDAVKRDLRDNKNWFAKPLAGDNPR